ncbi:hypothetical protein [Niabella beijingensis]|uniref:hypothetical protein n=1 Tax=Niabella beijingensis TaxID=2872700 RepID=UPI001CC008BD|nr:hypothetical protein [Niabella beijingensis]MBZ4191897.1 hypothetical protein [Niabella beijingensis]
MNIFKNIFGKKKDTLNWQQLTELFAGSISKALNTKTTIEWGPDAAQTRIVSTSPGGVVMSSFVGNMVTRCIDDPSPLNRNAVIEEHINTLAADMDRADNIQSLEKAHILPVIKSLQWLDTVRKQYESAGGTAAEAAVRFALQPLGDDLIVVYVNDTPGGMSYLSPAEISEAGFPDAAGLHQAALQNLRAKLKEAVFEGGGGRYAIRLDNNYDASLVLLLDEILPSIRINGNPVVALPSRDELMICGDQDTESVESLQDIAGQIYAVNAYTISKKLYAWDQGTLKSL